MVSFLLIILCAVSFLLGMLVQFVIDDKELVKLKNKTQLLYGPMIYKELDKKYNCKSEMDVN